MTANTPRSRKSKGAKFQNEVRDLLLEKFSDKLEPDDIKTAVMGESGTTRRATTRGVFVQDTGRTCVSFCDL